jgi:hypothetical protein
MSRAKNLANLIGGASAGTGGLALPSGTTAQRPSSAQAGTIRNNTTLGFPEWYSATSNNWEGFSGSKITNIQVTNSSYTVLDDTAVDSAGGYIKITGTGFTNGCQVVIGNIVATSVSFVSSTEVRCQVPAQTAGSYTVYLTNSDGSVAIRVNGLNYSGVPAWSTTSPLPQQVKNTSINLQLSSSSNSTVTYSLQAGSTLPSGITLSSSGLLSGTTPNVANETIYNFTILATDQENQDTARAFQITIIAGDPYYYLTALHLPGTVPNSLTTTFLSDASTNNFLLTPSGDASARSFSPYFNNYSSYFGGDGNYLSAAYSTDWAFSGDFSIEAWISVQDAGRSNDAVKPGTIVSQGVSGSTTNAWSFYFIITNGVISDVTFEVGTTTVVTISSQSIALNTWHHFAVCRSGSTVSIFVNGTRIATNASYSTSISANASGTLQLARNYYGSPYQNWTKGYFSNLRIVNGSSAYTATQTSITVPTAPLAAITNTKLLTCQANRFIDSNTEVAAKTITVTGTSAIAQNSPFVSNDTTNGSGYFKGSGELLSNASDLIVPDTGDFTIEGWLYPLSVTATQYVFATGGGTKLLIYITVSSYIGVQMGGSAYRDASTTKLIANAWNHVAVTRTGTTYNIYVNGILQTISGTGTVPSTLTNTPTYIGDNSSATNSFVGYLSNFRISNTVRTGLTTVPTTSYVSDANTSLLTLQTRAPATNNGFIDSSPNNFVITRNGNATQGTFSPFSPTGWSVFFDGSNDFLELSTQAILNVGTGNFTVECFVNFTNKAQTWSRATVLGTTEATSSSALLIQVLGATQGAGGIAVNAAGAGITASTPLATNTWHHIAVVRNSGTMILYINGTASGNVASSGSLTTPSYKIGAFKATDSQYDDYYNGYVSNFRTANVAVYTSNFTPPTTPLTLTTGGQNPPQSGQVKFLSCQSNRFLDVGPGAYTVTPTNGPTIQAFSPFAPTAAYNSTLHGGSVYLDGTGDWLYTGTGLASPSGSDFTIEMWLYPTSFSSTSYPLFTTTNGSKSDFIALELNTSGSLLVYITGTSTWSISSATVGSIILNQWTHIALTRSGTSFKTYINGKYIQGTVTSSQSVGSFNGFNIGQSGASNGYFTGYISGIRYVVGTAITGDFTVPSAPLTSTTGTQLLLNSTNSGVFDATGKNVVETAGTAHINTSVSKFGGGSIRFNGVSNTGLRLAASNILSPFTGDYTYEFWVYFNSFSGTPVIFETRRVNGLNPGLQLYCTTAGVLTLYGDATTGTLLITGATLSTGQWYHIALVRSGLGSNNTKLYLNGTQTGSSATDTTNYNNQGGTIGSHTANDNNFLNGYINDFRVTRYARYTSSFTPPASLVPLQ